MNATAYCADSGNLPVAPQYLFNLLLKRIPITDCVWQEHRFVPALKSQDEVSP